MREKYHKNDWASEEYRRKCDFDTTTSLSKDVLISKEIKTEAQIKASVKAKEEERLRQIRKQYI